MQMNTQFWRGPHPAHPSQKSEGTCLFLYLDTLVSCEKTEARGLWVVASMAWWTYLLVVFCQCGLKQCLSSALSQEGGEMEDCPPSHPHGRSLDLEASSCQCFRR